MTLEQLEKNLYRPGGGEELEKEREEKSEYDPKFSSQNDSDIPKETQWKELPPGFFSKYKKPLIIGGVVLVLALGGAMGFVSYKRSQGIFNRENVLLSIDGPKTIVSGDTVEYVIAYTNKSVVNLTDVELSLIPPKDLADIKFKVDNVEKEFSKKIKIGNLEKQTIGTIRLKGRIIGIEKSLHYLEATLSFKPDNISSQFEIDSKFTTTIKDIPLQFSLGVPKEVSSGDELNYTFDVINNTENSLENIEIGWELPDGFAVKFSDPELDKENKIKIPILKGKEGVQVKINGTLRGNIDDTKVVKVSLGQTQNGNFIKYGEEQSPTRISSSYLTVAQTVNGSDSYKALPGEKLTYVVSYKNNTAVGIGEVIVSAELNSELFDLQSLDANDGSFDIGTKTITWKGANAPGLLVLSPQEEGQVEFSINIKQRLPIENYNDKNFILKSIAKIESSEIPASLNVNKIIQSNESEVKIISKLVLQAKAYYSEPTANMTNSGPLPPKVGQETTFTVHWQILNLTNDVENVKLTSSLPPNTRWTDQTTTTNNTNIKYNNNTNEITWEVGKIQANTGILYPAIEAIFQVALTPSPNQLGTSPDIINSAQMSGLDTFTNVTLEAKTEKLNTDLPDDSQNKGKGEVE